MQDKGPLLIGGSVLALLLFAQVLAPASWRTRALDLLLVADARVGPARTQEPPFDVVVVDIDRASLEAIGPWPWPRLTMARLVEAVAREQPAAIGIDILFAETDQRSPAALARQLAAATGRAELDALAATLPDGDAALADAVGAAQVALGFVLDPDSEGQLPGAAFVTSGHPNLDGLWQGSGASGPVPMLMAAASGLGSLSLPGEEDGIVRQVPLLVAVGQVVLPGLALETLRLAAGSSAFRLSAQPDGTTLLDAGGPPIPLPQAAMLRLLPASSAGRQLRTVPAADLLHGTKVSLADDIVLIGSSAPESGGLRGTPFDPLTPSVQIQARAVGQLMGGRVIADAPAWVWLERAAAVILGILAILAALALGPFPGVLALAVISMAWTAGSFLLLHQADLLLDPVSPVLVATGPFAAAALSAFAITQQREHRLRESFGQRLHPAVVERLARRPDRLKLAGERREVTVLVTDLEGFTGLTRRADPQVLISLLDRYLDGISRIVVAHGGMIDKLVGDAVHGIFNAPVDLPNHAQQALAAARAIRQWAEQFCAEPDVAVHRFGRTRIGLECGEVIVGDVGLGTRLDYTAYGDAVNVAVRLEGMNKQFGTAILVGPRVAALVPPEQLRALGIARIRGRDEPLQLFTLAGEA
jgi:adenylate cyclase